MPQPVSSTVIHNRWSVSEALSVMLPFSVYLQAFSNKAATMRFSIFSLVLIFRSSARVVSNFSSTPLLATSSYSPMVFLSRAFTKGVSSLLIFSVDWMSDSPMISSMSEVIWWALFCIIWEMC